MQNVAENLRFLLWRENVERSHWPGQLASWADCDPKRGEALLAGTSPSAAEQERIAHSLEIAEEDILYGRLLETSGVNVLVQNLHFLFSSLEYGQKQTIAHDLGVREGTVSRWLRGDQKPHRRTLERLRQRFGLPEGTNLAVDPIFLESGPVGEVGQKEWLRRQIDQLDETTLRALFPALERLLRD